jgi:hypothetical protein
MRISLALLVPLVMAIGTAAVPAASGHSGLTTTFDGRFACAGTGAPLVGARVELHGADASTSSRSHYWQVTVGVADGETGADGQWSFTVERGSLGIDYWPVLVLDTPALGIVDYLTGSALEFAGPDHLNDVDQWDFETLEVPTNVCTLWNQLRASYVGYVRLMGKAPRYGKLIAKVNAPTLGYPYTLNTTIMWPHSAAMYEGTIAHEFAHTIRNASLGGEGAFLEEVSDSDFRVRLSPCRRTTPKYAFHEGWAGFWASDFYPAPNCPGVSADDPAVEGNVAWTLTRLERSCAAASRRRMVQVLIEHGPTIHSLGDFVARLGSCQALPLDPGSVPRYRVAPAVSPELFSRDVHAAVTREHGRITALTKLLPGLDRAAAGASCQRPPCTDAIGRKIAPIVARAELEQARFIASTLSARVSAKAITELRKPPTRTSLDRVTEVPATLARGLGKVGFTSMTKALTAARPLASGDHSRPTRSLISTLASFRSDFRRASRTGTGLPTGFPVGGVTPPTVPSVATRHAISFGDLSDGTVITTQTASAGASFGSAATLGFRDKPPIYVCPAGPTATQGAAVAPTCDSPTAGFLYTGTLARLSSPARTVTVRVGATQTVPGGLPVEIDVFDAAGKPASRGAILVGSSTNGQAAGPVSSLSVHLPRQAHAITFVAIFVNSLIGSQARLVFDDLGFSE